MGNKNKERVNIDLNSKSAHSVPGRGASASRGRSSARDYVRAAISSDTSAGVSLAADVNKTYLDKIAKDAGRTYKSKNATIGAQVKNQASKNPQTESSRDQYVGGLVKSYNDLVGKMTGGNAQPISGGGTTTGGGTVAPTKPDPPKNLAGGGVKVVDKKASNGKGTKTTSNLKA